MIDVFNVLEVLIMQIVTYHIPNFKVCIGAIFVNRVPLVAIAHRPAREMAILVDPLWAKALGDQLRNNSPLSFLDGKDIGR